MILCVRLGIFQALLYHLDVTMFEFDKISPSKKNVEISIGLNV
jgi:hypothetical protein